jgi:hypothetical protein
MGQAFTAVAEGPSAVWWNPGALGLLDGVWAMPYGKRELLSDEASQHSFGLSCGRQDRGAAIHLDHVRYDPTDILDVNGSSLGTFRPWEYTARVGGGLDLARYLRPDHPGRLRLGAGLALKYARVKFGEGRRFGMSGTGTGWGIDLGALAVYRRPWTSGGPAPSETALRESGFYGLRAGIAAPNLIQRQVHWDGVDSTDPLGREVRLGVAAEAALPSLPRSTRLGSPLHFLVSVDGRWGLEEYDRTPIWHAGVEGRLFEFVSARTGYVRDRRGDIEDWTSGLGIGMEATLPPSSRYGGLGWRFDYASIPVAESLGDLRLHQYTLSGWLLW